MASYKSKLGLDQVNERSFAPVKNFKDMTNLTSINSPTAFSRNHIEGIESFPISKFAVAGRINQRPQTAGIIRQKMTGIFSVKSKRNIDVYGAIPAQESYK